MLYTIAIVLVILWALGLVSSYTMGGFIHILLVLAVVVILVNFLSGRTSISMNIVLRQALGACGLAFATCASAQISFYENEGFTGRSFTTQEQVKDFSRFG